MNTNCFTINIDSTIEISPGIAVMTFPFDAYHAFLNGVGIFSLLADNIIDIPESDARSPTAIDQIFAKHGSPLWVGKNSDEYVLYSAKITAEGYIKPKPVDDKTIVVFITKRLDAEYITLLGGHKARMLGHWVELEKEQESALVMIEPPCCAIAIGDILFEYRENRWCVSL